MSGFCYVTVLGDDKVTQQSIASVIRGEIPLAPSELLMTLIQRARIAQGDLALILANPDHVQSLKEDRSTDLIVIAALVDRLNSIGVLDELAAALALGERAADHGV